MRYTRRMTMTQQLKEPVVDRSPELSRGPQFDYHSEGTRTLLDTADAAAEAVRGDGEKCLLAVLIRKVLPGCTPHVEGEHPYITMPDGKSVPLVLAPEVVTAIGEFDRGEGPGFAALPVITITRS